MSLPAKPERDSPAGYSPGGAARTLDGFCDLRSYGAIGDGRTAALIARDGRIDWMPVPNLDSPPAFAALLDADDGGYIALAPVDSFDVERSYVAGTNVLATTFHTSTGSVRITDSLNSGIAGRLPWLELARRIEGLTGSVRLQAEIAPGNRLNTAAPWVQQTAHGAVLRVDGLTMAVRVRNESASGQSSKTLTAEFVTEPGSRHLLGLVATEREPLFLPSPADLDRGVDRTIENWQRWSSEFSWEGDWAEAVQRSALALKLLVQSSTGSIAAAATMALPENRAGGKNWDYRFAWIRDAAYTIRALFRFGLREETHAAVSWLLATIGEHGPVPKPFYTLDGQLPSGRRDCDVPGWRGIGPVVDGNDAADQLQLGVYGDLFSVVRLYVDSGNVLDSQTARLLVNIADRACDEWRMRDAGIWELPDEQHYTTSKLGCWHALTCAVHLAENGHLPADSARWRAEAEQIRTWVSDNCWDADRGCYTWYPGSTELDASILLHAISGFDRGPKMSATLDALQADLGSGPHLYRYTGMSEEEGSFVACSFWMVSALHLVGRRDEARERMSTLVCCANDVGLYAEMIDPNSGEFLGNLPQALSHLALITAAITLAKSTD